MIFAIPLRRFLLIDSFIVVFVLALASACFAQESSFPVPADLTGAVEFWKQIFTGFSAKEVVFFDPLDPGKIYSVLRAPENEEGRLIIERERLRIIADYELNEEDGRIRSQRGAKELFLSGLKMSGRYVVQMRNIFRAEGLPPDLAYLPLVESSFNVRARSSVGAAGMWQFMPDTGKKFLRIDNAVDERMDPMVSTRAAARLLKENYKLFGNWPLAITAYNHGTEGIFRGISATGSPNLADLIRRYQSPTFGFASKNFYTEFLAAAQIAKNSEAYFPFLRSFRPMAFHEVAVDRPVRIQAVLKPAAISHNDFFDWNPALNPTTQYLPVGYRVKVPPEKVSGFLAAQRSLVAAPAAKKAASVTKRRNTGSGNGQNLGTGKTLVKHRGPNRSSAAGVPKSKRPPEGRSVATEPRIGMPNG